jgi:hypothetical protein
MSNNYETEIREYKQAVHYLIFYDFPDFCLGKRGKGPLRRNRSVEGPALRILEKRRRGRFGQVALLEDRFAVEKWEAEGPNPTAKRRAALRNGKKAPRCRCWAQ